MSKSSVPFGKWLPVVGLAWLLPGGGHFLLQRRTRGLVLAVCVLVAFVAGLLMRGALFSPQTGDLFTTIIYCGGFAGNLAAGGLYLLSVMFGYAQPDVAGHVHDYGTKFLVAAGLMNVLAMVDAYEIAAGKKD
jgi:drug/metabolite transporter (DMT)-like permease